MDVLVSEMPPLALGLFAFGFGACWGSFFNVAIYRWPRGISVVTPPSHCPTCHARIPARLNIPILSYVLLRGKTACCGQALSARYPVVEILGAVLCLAVTWQQLTAAPTGMRLTQLGLVALCYFVFVGGLLIASFVDLEHMEIPDEVSLPVAALGLATASLRDHPGAVDAALGAGLGFLVVQVLFVWCYELLTGRRGMGEGDAKLLLMIGAFIGWQGVLFSLFAGAAQGLIVSVFGLLTGKPLGPGMDDAPDPEAEGGEDGDTEEDDHADGEPPPRYVGHLKVPFGPFLALSALEFLFFGDQLVDRWLSFVAG